MRISVQRIMKHRVHPTVKKPKEQWGVRHTMFGLPRGSHPSYYQYHCLTVPSSIISIVSSEYQGNISSNVQPSEGATPRKSFSEPRVTCKQNKWTFRFSCMDCSHAVNSLFSQTSRKQEKQQEVYGESRHAVVHLIHPGVEMMRISCALSKHQGKYPT